MGKTTNLNWWVDLGFLEPKVVTWIASQQVKPTSFWVNVGCTPPTRNRRGETNQQKYIQQTSGMWKVGFFVLFWGLSWLCLEVLVNKNGGGVELLVFLPVGWETQP